MEEFTLSQCTYFSEIILDAKTITNLCTTKLLFLEFGDRKSMQRSHLQCSSEMPQNPKGEQQGSPLCGSHSATGPPSHARLGNPHLPALLILIPAIFRRIHNYCHSKIDGTQNV